MQYNYTELIKWVSKHIGTKFEWGSTDCTTLTLEGLKVFYGEDVFKKVPQWYNKISALRVYNEIGVPSTLIKDFGFEEVIKNYEQTGDLIILHTEPLETLGIIINNSVVIIDPAQGVVLQNLHYLTQKYSCYRRKEKCPK